MKGRSSAVPEWQESKIAVRRTPGRSGLTLDGLSYYFAHILLTRESNVMNLHDIMHIVVYNMASNLVIDWIYNIVES